MAAHSHCAVCLDSYTDAVLLPACGHSFCKLCVEALPTSRRNLRAAREALCPLCRTAYTPGSAVPNFGLRQSIAVGGSDATGLEQVEDRATRLEQDRTKWALPACPPPRPDRLAALGIPPGLSRIACDEARGRVGLRLFLLDNSGSTAAMDGHVLRPSSSSNGDDRALTLALALARALTLALALALALNLALTRPHGRLLVSLGRDLRPGRLGRRTRQRHGDAGRVPSAQPAAARQHCPCECRG